MPAAIPFIPLMVAGVGATGAVIKGKMDSNAAKRAAAAQQQASNQALDYQKGRDSRADMFQDKRWAMYQEAVNAWRARNGGATGSSGTVTSSGGGGGASMPVSIADLVGQQQGVADASGAPADQQAPPGSIAANVGGWNDWNRHLSGSAGYGA